ncbi:MAG: GAF domain-containing sensor histidine kinase [Oscillochloridaceae bacterium]|nr:GAF domain-containing sensor histidine kinase [Chloroflexaceae bacterium]MDW8391482.1 GAF domain-containing sensor histidine kinase [Oscillochloridaceae bacterium]
MTRLGDAALPEAVLQLGCEILGADRGLLHLPHPRHGIELVARYPDDATLHPADALDSRRLTWQTLHSSLPQIIDCVHDDEARWEYCHGEDCRLTLSAPLQWEGQNIAVVQLSYDGRRPAIETTLLSLVYEYAELAALALVQHERLRVAPDRLSGQTVCLADANQHAFGSGVSAVLAAGEAERARIARDLHDGARQALLGAQLHLEAMREALQRGDTRAIQDHLSHGRTALNTVEQELARIVRNLHPPRLDKGDLSITLTELARQWTAATQTLTLCTVDPCLPPLEATQAIALYRIVQEALANCSRHARASRVAISLHCDDKKHVTLVIDDDGRGGASPRGGAVGLLSMAQRAHAIGAEFLLDSPPGRGTRVVVRLPLEHRCPRQSAGGDA